MIYTSTRGAVHDDRDIKGRFESRFVSPRDYPIDGEVTVLGDLIVMISSVETSPVGVMTRNLQVADSLKAMFEMAWHVAGRLNAR